MYRNGRYTKKINKTFLVFSDYTFDQISQNKHQGYIYWFLSSKYFHFEFTLNANGYILYWTMSTGPSNPPHLMFRWVTSQLIISRTSLCFYSIECLFFHCACVHSLSALRCLACCYGLCVGQISSTHSTSCGRSTASRPSTTSPPWFSAWPWWG